MSRPELFLDCFGDWVERRESARGECEIELIRSGMNGGFSSSFEHDGLVGDFGVDSGGVGDRFCWRWRWRLGVRFGEWGLVDVDGFETGLLRFDLSNIYLVAILLLLLRLGVVLRRGEGRGGVCDLDFVCVGREGFVVARILAVAFFDVAEEGVVAGYGVIGALGFGHAGEVEEEEAWGFCGGFCFERVRDSVGD